MIRLKDKEIIAKIEKAYEVKAPNVLDKLYFTQENPTLTFPKKKFISVRVATVCCTSLIFIIGITLIVMHYNFNDSSAFSPTHTVIDNQISTQDSIFTPNTDNISVIENEIPELSYEIPYSCDYVISTDQKSMFEAADVVIEGIYDGTISTSATEIGQIISVGKISHIKMIKGSEISEKELKISYYGGVLKVSDFLKQVGPEYSLNYRFENLTEDEADNKYIGIKPNEFSANPKQGLKYLIFLAYDEITGEYFVLCDGYGIREINNYGEVWNIDLSEFEKISIETETKD